MSELNDNNLKKNISDKEQNDHKNKREYKFFEDIERYLKENKKTKLEALASSSHSSITHDIEYEYNYEMGPRIIWKGEYPCIYHRNLAEKDDIDQRYNGTRFYCSQYATEIMYNKEIKSGLCTPYQYVNTTQTKAGNSMAEHHRLYMIWWMHETYLLLDLDHEGCDIYKTPQLAINYLDRFLEKVPVEHRDLSKVAYACFLLAMKMEEVVLDMPKFLKCTKNVSTSSILKFQRDIVNTLEGDLDIPNISLFIERYLQVLDMKRYPSIKVASHFLGHLILCMYESLKYHYTCIAIAVVYWAYCKNNDMDINEKNYPEILYAHTNISFDAIKEIIDLLNFTLDLTKDAYKKDNSQVPKIDEYDVVAPVYLYKYYLSTCGRVFFPLIPKTMKV